MLTLHNSDYVSVFFETAYCTENDKLAQCSSNNQPIIIE